MAMLKVSYNMPWRAAPSPMKQTVTWSSLRYLSAKAMPAPRPIWPPTMPCPPKRLRSLSNMCIEPPFPLEVPVFLPYISAITYLGSVPNTKGWAWSRYAVMTRSVGRMASRMPESTASCPMYKWQKPPNFCWM